MSAPSRLTCHLFCQVVDNFGDAGVCWRLARQLSVEYDWQVVLFIDRVDVLARIVPGIEPTVESQDCLGVVVQSWHTTDRVLAIPNVVIEAFGCQQPEPSLARLRSQRPAPVWINLEYLSAEGWIESCHALPSPDPVSGRIKYFFFPGFSEASGGLIRETDYPKRAAPFEEDDVRRRFLTDVGVQGIDTRDFPISVFCYPDAPLPGLVNIAKSATFSGRQPLWLLPETTAEAYPQVIRANPERCRIIPFLAQNDYDRLLLSCDLNLVRGEDSFVRAQLAARPFVWQAYRQEGGVQRGKVDAFLALFLSKADATVARAVRDFSLAWNGFSRLDAATWHRFVVEFDQIADHVRQWRNTLEKAGSVAEKLVHFCESRL